MTKGLCGHNKLADAVGLLNAILVHGPTSPCDLLKAVHTLLMHDTGRNAISKEKMTKDMQRICW